MIVQQLLRQIVSRRVNAHVRLVPHPQFCVPNHGTGLRTPLGQSIVVEAIRHRLGVNLDGHAQTNDSSWNNQEGTAQRPGLLVLVMDIL